ncbi:MAG: leucine-rich repeat domain-containing protein [Clostridia bacterium]|nr:leucine-rich repeat domain-containing protein [Clostridia bacterium]
MKKMLLFFLLCTLIFVSCGKKENYTPDFTLAEGYTLKDERITATVIGAGDLPLSSFLMTKEKVTVFADSTGDRYVQGLDASVPLKAGENHMVLRFSNGTYEREYNLDITCITLRSFSVTVTDPDKTYHIGERFDRNTIRVVGITQDGKEIEITQYEPEYEFSSLGKSTIGIELDGHYESFSVMVTEEYRPVLDANGYADGIHYEMSETEATLLNASETEGFFAVPSVVTLNAKEYPVTAIAPLAFEGTEITSIQIPDTVHRIGDEAFSGCRTLTWVEMPESMKEIGKHCFADCISLMSIAIPDGIVVIGDGTFRGCEALTRVVLPKSLTTIGERAFFGCKSLETIKFPNELSVIEASAFENCKSLSSVIAQTLQNLGNRAFFGCDALTVFAAGDIENIGTDIFPENTKLTVYMRAGSMLLMEADKIGADTVFMKNGEYHVVSLPIEFPIESDYPYHETLILRLQDGRMKELSDYTVSYPKDACGYLEAVIEAEDFSYTFTVFIVYTEDIALDTDTRGVRYELDTMTRRATLVCAPVWVRKSDIYEPEQEGLFLVPTTLWREDGMYVVTDIAEGAFDEAQNVQNIFIPRLTEDS